MINLLGVFIGGGIGSLLRHLVCLRIGSHWAVFLVNILGALFIGMAFEYFAAKTDMRPELRSFVITGLLGGFTTFSTYMLDFGLLVNNQKTVEGLVYMFGSLAAGAAFLFLGMRLVKACL
ncbi:MAG: CrcB family protein [Proteobacteria bacterium]|nr:CrcB family protein [Pseudomonadota bacterium]